LTDASVKATLAASRDAGQRERSLQVRSKAVNEGIGQVIFLESDEECDVSYEDRGGKYQGQTGLTYSRL